MGWERVEALAEAGGPGAEVAVAARLVGTGRVWEHGGRQVFPAASTIKTAILVALYRDVDAGRLDLEARVAVQPEASAPGSGVLTWMRPGLSLPLADLAYLMIAVSDNTASNLVLDVVGIERVRATIADLDLASTQLNRPFLGHAPGPGESENVTCALDLADLLAAIADGSAASAEACRAMRATLALQQDRDRLARFLPRDAPFAGKSGTLPGEIYDTGLLETPAGLLAVAVLTRGFAARYAAEETIGRIGLALVGEESQPT